MPPPGGDVEAFMREVEVVGVTGELSMGAVVVDSMIIARGRAHH